MNSLLHWLTCYRMASHQPHAYQPAHHPYSLSQQHNTWLEQMKCQLYCMPNTANPAFHTNEMSPASLQHAQHNGARQRVGFSSLRTFRLLSCCHHSNWLQGAGRTAAKVVPGSAHIIYSKKRGGSIGRSSGSNSGSSSITPTAHTTTRNILQQPNHTLKHPHSPGHTSLEHKANLFSKYCPG